MDKVACGLGLEKQYCGGQNEGGHVGGNPVLDKGDW